MKKLYIIFALIFSMVFVGGCSLLSSDKEPASRQVKDETKNKKDEENKPIVKEPINENNEEPEDETEPAEAPDNSEEKLSIEFEGVTFDIPDYFIELENEEDFGMPVIVYIMDHGASFNLVVEDLSAYPGITFEEYMEATFSHLDYEYENAEFGEINGMTIHQGTSPTLENGVKLQQTTFIHDQKAYIFSYGSLPEIHEEHLPTVDEILHSVSFD